MKRPQEAANEYQAALLSVEPYPEAKPDLDRVLASLGMSSDSQ
jgi:hypothetical protein